MRFIYNYLLIFVMLCIPLFSSFAETENSKHDNINYQGSRSYIPNKLTKTSSEAGKEIFARYSVHDGNLVLTGFLNQGQFCQGWDSGLPSQYDMLWPRGSEQAGYGYVFNFFVAGQVENVKGQTVHIVSDRFKRKTQNSPDGTHGYYLTPLPKYFNHDSPDATEVPIGGISEDMGIDGLPNTNDEGEGDGELQSSEDFNGNGVLDLSMQNVVEYCAMSHRRETWPTYWPSRHPEDRRGTDIPDYRAGVWNGEFGEYVRADQESFYVMDDSENDEFEYYPFNFPGTDIPDTTAWPNCRRGLGVTIEVRNYQWAARLAEDILVSIYDIYNYGHNIDYSVIGMWGDADVSGLKNGDTADWDQEDDIVYVWDPNESWRQQGKNRTGYFGFAFLESPGLEDGIDNDEDGMVDETQYDKIDNDEDWTSFVDENANGIYDTEDLNGNGLLDDGEDANNNGFFDYEFPGDDLGTDGIGPGMQDYTGPDDDGTECNGKPDTGEPNFDNTDNDESDQVGLTSFYIEKISDDMSDDETFWYRHLQPGEGFGPGFEEDVTFTYGCGFVPLYNVQEYAESHGGDPFHRYAIACLFGNDMDDILRNKHTMQTIYDNDYNFAKPPRKPWLKAIAGDGQVVLQWDNSAEESLDPIYGKDFEGYKIYRSTDPSFDDIKTITDAYSNPVNYEPIAQYDLVDGLTGAHPITTGREGGQDSDYGVAMTMGTDSGLRHSYVDTNLTNGRSYYYAVTSYDKGYDSDFYNRDFVTTPDLSPISPTECSMTIQTDALGGLVYVDQNCALAIPQEPTAGYITPHLESGMEHIEGDATGVLSVSIISPSEVLNNHTYRVGFTDDGYFKDLTGDGDSLYTGYTKSCCLVDITEDDTLFNLSYIPIAGNERDLYFNSNEESILIDKIYDGFQLTIDNSGKETVGAYEYLTVVSNLKYNQWTKGNSNLSVYLDTYLARIVPRDYEVRILEPGADISMTKKIVTNFQIWDVTDPDKEFKLPFKYSEARAKPDEYAGQFYPGDKITIYIKPVLQDDNTYENKQKSWRFNVSIPSNEEMIYPENGDVYKIITEKSFDSDDIYEFTIIGNMIQEQTLKDELADIYVVPNPYIAQSTLEAKLVDTSLGRGNRRIDFVNLPAQCTIKIFTVAGRLVREINHDASMTQGRESWDLRSKDGLEVAAGYYFYYVEAPGLGGVKGKFAIIK